MDFDAILAWTRKAEGNGTTEDDVPTGMGGMTQSLYWQYLRDKALPLKNVAQITETEYRDIMLVEFWNMCHCDEIAAIDADLAAAVFDTAVNMGPAEAIKVLQTILLSVKPDGNCGPLTIGAVKRMYGLSGPRAAVRLVNPVQIYLVARIGYYIGRHQQQWINGWTNRVLDLGDFLNCPIRHLF